MKRRQGGLTIMFLPDEGGKSRSLRLSPRGARFFLIGGVLAAALMAVMVSSWWFLALEASRGWQLEVVVDSLEEERLRILSLAENLSRVETEYEHLRSLFGPSVDPVAPDLWLPPAGLPGGGSVSGGATSDANTPSGWPLTEPGFVTQALVEGGTRDHPGLDIAIPTDSYVRASGAGRVLRIGDDPVYGLFIVLEHGGGFQTIYGHTSLILVERGRTVRRGEVIALSGSTGQSTAPHLHFEILLDGVPIDPLSMVEQPG